MGSNTDKVGPRSNSGATEPGFTITGRNMDGRKAQAGPINRGKGSKKK